MIGERHIEQSGRPSGNKLGTNPAQHFCGFLEPTPRLPSAWHLGSVGAGLKLAGGRLALFLGGQPRAEWGTGTACSLPGRPTTRGTENPKQCFHPWVLPRPNLCTIPPTILTLYRC